MVSDSRIEEANAESALNFSATEDEAITLSRNVGHQSPSDAAPHAIPGGRRPSSGLSIC